MSHQKWYYSRDLKPQGPLTLEEVRDLVRTGEIRPRDLICQGLGGWQPAEQCFEFSLFPARQEVSFEDTFKAEWVVLSAGDGTQGYRQEGPLTAAQIREKIIAGDLSWESPIWKPGLKGWAKIIDRPEFYSRDLS